MEERIARLERICKDLIELGECHAQMLHIVTEFMQDYHKKTFGEDWQTTIKAAGESK